MNTNIDRRCACCRERPHDGIRDDHSAGHLCVRCVADCNTRPNGCGPKWDWS